MKRRTKRGGVAITALVAITVLLTITGSMLNANTTNMRTTIRSVNNELTYEAAQAGLEMVTARAVGLLTTNNGQFLSSTSDVSNDLSGILSGCTASAVVAPQSDPTWAWITCTVSYSGYTRSERQLINAKNVGIWNNAIFAGSGASGQSINGNVNIRGSVHSLGDGEDYIDVNGNAKWDQGDPYTDKAKLGYYVLGDPFTDLYGTGKYQAAEPFNDVNGSGVYQAPLTSASLDATFSGSAQIGNNYQGIPLALQECIPNCPTINGVQTLSAEVRVKHGQISLSGSATVGQSGSINGGTMKGTIDGVYVNDGFTGNKGAANVFSDNGTNNQYDLGNLGITFPLISGIGAQNYTDKSGTVWTTQQAYLQARSLTCPVTTITHSTAAFSYGPDAYGNSISFTPASGNTPCLLKINGIIRFTSQLQFGTKDSMYYSGNGTLYDDSDIYIDGDVLPASGLVFPTTARIGFIANRDMYIACGNGSAGITTTGAYYAQGNIKSAKQTNTAGTFVASFFDMGTNVPSIFQVPSLPYNMPPGMPGDKSYFSTKFKGWRDRYVAPSH